MHSVKAHFAHRQKLEETIRTLQRDVINTDLKIQEILRTLWLGTSAEAKELLRPFISSEEAWHLYFMEVLTRDVQTFKASAVGFKLSENQIKTRTAALNGYLRGYFTVTCETIDGKFQLTFRADE
jgi:hypothetical protein